MINFMHLEFCKKIFNQLKERYPEIELIEIAESVEDSDTLWVEIAMPENEDREIEAQEMGAELATDVLLEHGHDISVHVYPISLARHNGQEKKMQL